MRIADQKINKQIKKTSGRLMRICVWNDRLRNTTGEKLLSHASRWDVSRKDGREEEKDAQQREQNKQTKSGHHNAPLRLS